MQENVIAALRRSSAWPGGPAPIEVIETHAAIVFLAGKEAFKIKRAVRLPYLDFTALDTRHRIIEKEFALNAPHAPQIYLGVVPIRRTSDGAIAVGDGPGDVVEWALRMRRFDQSLLLSNLAANGALPADLVKRLAMRTLAYHRAAPQPPDARFDIGALADPIVQRIASHTETAAGEAGRKLARLMQPALAKATPVLQRRAAKGFVRRCHGDLHLANIVLWDGEPLPFDALEFDDGLATIDTLYDLAFLVMDIDRRGARPSANLLLAHYLWASGEPIDVEGLAALPVFLAARAAIRAMVAMDRIAGGVANSGSMDHILETLARAADYLEPPPPRLVAIGGLSGSGKSTLSAQLAPHFGAAPGALHLRTDLERKHLAGIAETAALPQSAYTKDSGARTYARVRERARLALAAGHSVIADGVFADPVERQAIADVASSLGVPFSGIWLEAPERTLRDRVHNRTGDASDATEAVVERQLAAMPADVHWWRMASEGHLDDVVRRAARHLILAIA